MPKSPGQKLKILYLAKFFLEETDENHIATMPQILSYLKRAGIEAERKSVYSDMEDLELFGFDIVRQRGKNCGYFLGERKFQLPEVRLLVDAVQSSRFLTRKKSEELIDKLRSLASRHEAGVLGHNVFVSGRVKTMNESIYLTVDTLSLAIEEDKMVRFFYYDWDMDGNKALKRNGQAYTVSPYFLLWDDEKYYLVAVDEKTGEKRHFRVDKMEKITLLSEKRKGKEYFKDFSPAVYENKSFGMFGGKEERVTLWWSEDLAGVFYDRFGKESTIRKREGGFLSSHSVLVSPVFFSFLMSFGDKVRITGPDWVKDEFVKHTKSILRSYEKEEKNL